MSKAREMLSELHKQAAKEGLTFIGLLDTGEGIAASVYGSPPAFAKLFAHTILDEDDPDFVGVRMGYYVAEKAVEMHKTQKPSNNKFKN